MILKKLKQIRCRLLLIGKYKISFGKTSTFGRGTVFYALNSMTIGENVYIGKYCSLETDIEIGNDVLIGNNGNPGSHVLWLQGCCMESARTEFDNREWKIRMVS